MVKNSMGHGLSDQIISAPATLLATPMKLEKQIEDSSEISQMPVPSPRNGEPQQEEEVDSDYKSIKDYDEKSPYQAEFLSHSFDSRPKN